MGDFPVADQYIFAGSTWVDWVSDDITIWVRLKQGSEERCLKHLATRDQYQIARDVFHTDIFPKIKAADQTTLNEWSEVTLYSNDSDKPWIYLIAWNIIKGSGGLVLYHINPPGYAFDAPFVGSERQKAWFNNTDHERPKTADDDY